MLTAARKYSRTARPLLDSSSSSSSLHVKLSRLDTLFSCNEDMHLLQHQLMQKFGLTGSAAA